MWDVGPLGVFGIGSTPSGGGWTPASLTNLVAWYKADTGRTGSPITALANQAATGSAYDLVNNGTVPFTATSTYNSLPAINFTAANDAALYVPIPSAPFPVALPDPTKLAIFVVGRMNTGTASFGRLVSIGQGGNPDYAVAGNVAPLIRDSSNNNFRSDYNTAVLDPQAISLATNYRLGAVWDGTNLTHYINNVGATPVASTINLTTPTTIVIGNVWNGSGSLPPASTVFQGAAWDGPVLEIVIAASAPSPSDLNSLDTYFTSRGF